MLQSSGQPFDPFRCGSGLHNCKKWGRLFVGFLCLHFRFRVLFFDLYEQWTWCNRRLVHCLGWLLKYYHIFIEKNTESIEDKTRYSTRTLTVKMRCIFCSYFLSLWAYLWRHCAWRIYKLSASNSKTILNYVVHCCLFDFRFFFCFLFLRKYLTHHARATHALRTSCFLMTKIVSICRWD